MLFKIPPEKLAEEVFEDEILSLPLTNTEKKYLQRLIDDVFEDFKHHISREGESFAINLARGTHPRVWDEEDVVEEIKKLDKIKKVAKGCIVKHDRIRDIVKCIQEESGATIIPLGLGAAMVDSIVELRYYADRYLP